MPPARTSASLSSTTDALMTRMVKGTRYRKVQDRGSGARYGGRVHLIFWCTDLELYRLKHWRFVCGKRQPDYDLDCNDVDDETPVTCRACNKHAPDVVERMEDIPSLEDFQ